MVDDSTVELAAKMLREEMENLVYQLPLAFDASDLCGACGISSYVLARVLRRLGVRCDLVMGYYDPNGEKAYGIDNENHCWVEIPSKRYIVDVTATQFGIRSGVHIAPSGFPYIPNRRNKSAIKELENWDQQSHIWYESRLHELEERIVQAFRTQAAA